MIDSNIGVIKIDDVEIKKDFSIKNVLKSFKHKIIYKPSFFEMNDEFNSVVVENVTLLDLKCREVWFKFQENKMWYIEFTPLYKEYIANYTDENERYKFITNYLIKLLDCNYKEITTETPNFDKTMYFDLSETKINITISNDAKDTTLITTCYIFYREVE